MHEVLVLSNYNNIIYICHIIFLYIATYDTQSIDITSTIGDVCVVCKFSTHATSVGCEIELRNNNITSILTSIKYMS